MKKHLLFSGILFTCLQWNSGLHAQENVGVGTATPLYRLDVQGDPLSQDDINVRSNVNYLGNIDVRAFEGISITAPGWGIGGRFTGGFMGVQAFAESGNHVGNSIGVYGSANGTAGTRMGIYGTASGGVNNYGVYGQTSGGAGYFGVYGSGIHPGSYAGYFNGRGHFTNELRADKNLVVDDTIWTQRIWNPGGNLLCKSVLDIELTVDRDNTFAPGNFEVFNGAGFNLFTVAENGNSHSYGNHVVDDKLGIGLLGPSTKLHIQGGSDASLTDFGYAQFGATAGLNLIMDNNEIMTRNNGARADLYIQHDDGDLLFCGLEQGAVGIGVTTGGSLAAGYLLSVDGKIMAEELRVQNSTNWPDYVFKENYSLMPLMDLKKSIEANHHLPNIPSAKTIEEEGILVGDMQKRMMEKIEELTLYILQLHETNQKHHSEIESLRNELKELKANSSSSN